jgi:murein DD-endopeptidase MepM/ murein hydrolase activator NlpD
MKDLLKRLLVVAIMAICISILIFGGKEGHAKEIVGKASKFQWDWPTVGELTDHFGTRGGNHFGIDIASETGNSVHVVDDGEVVKSYYSSSYGNVIFVKHPGGIETVYAHLSKRAVEEGDNVKKGQFIGLVGNTGQSHGAHLHFEVHSGEWNIHKSNALDPLVFLEEKQLAKNIDETVETSSGFEVVKEAVRIESGDTLWALSNQYNVTVQELKQWNNLSNDIIVTGEDLIVYQKKSVPNIKDKGVSETSVQYGSVKFSLGDISY